MPSIALPHGTEVTTRAVRSSLGRRIAEGTVGRVVRARDGGYDVMFVGIGEVWYEATELATRKPGQLLFAERRQAAWLALRPCILLEAVVGSHAWGLADDTSDVDLRGVFALPFSWTCGLEAPPSDLVSADGSTIYWAHHKVIDQALRADPNTLEMLFVPSCRPCDELGGRLLAERDAFVSKAMFGTFGKYAMGQLKRLCAAQKMAAHREEVLAWLREAAPPDLDEIARRLAALAQSDGKSSDIASNDAAWAKGYIKQLYRSLYDQGLIAANDFGSLVSYARRGGAAPPSARDLRPKNAYTLLRLLVLATGWLEQGQPTFVVTGEFRDKLMSIKRGRVELSAVLAEAERLTPLLEQARDQSPLPEAPDYGRADALLREVGDEIARRWLAKVPGPFGADAPPAPVPDGSSLKRPGLKVAQSVEGAVDGSQEEPQ